MNVRRETGASCREDAKDFAESKIAQIKLSQKESSIQQQQGRVIDNTKRIFQSAESVQNRQAINHYGKIIHHGKLLVNENKITKPVVNRVEQAEFETLKQFKQRCLLEMVRKNDAQSRYQHAIEIQRQQNFDDVAETYQYFNDLVNIDKQNERVYRIKSSNHVEDVSQDVEDSFEEIFTTGSKTETQKKIPAPVWTIPIEPPPPEIPLKKQFEKVKAPVWTIPMPPPRTVTVPRRVVSQMKPREESLVKQAAFASSPNYKDDRNSSSPPSSEVPSTYGRGEFAHLPELEIHHTPTSNNLSFTSEVHY